MTSERCHVGLLAVIVLALAIGPYLNSLPGGFVFDDYGLVVENPGPPSSALTAFTAGEAGGVYRPLTLLTFMANERMDRRPFGYHVVNVALHAVVTLLAFVLARLLVGSLLAATATAALFAIHPIHTEAVSNIAARGELLAALFVLGMLAAFARARRSDATARAAWTGLSLVLFVAALLSKENSFTGILLVALVGIWLRSGRGWWPVVRSVVPYVIVGLGYLGFRLLVFGVLTQPKMPPVIDNPLAWVPAGPRVGTALVVLWQYLSVLAVPLRLSSDDSLSQIPIVTSFLDPRLMVAVGVFAVLAIGLVSMARRAPVLGFAALFMALSLTVTSNLLFPIGAIKAERFLYLPSFGWCLACGWLFHRWTATPRVRTLVGLALVVALAGRTWMRNRDWQTNLTLFTADVAASPNSARANSNAAAAYGQAGEIFMAMYHYQRALAIFPQYANAAAGLAQAYELRKLDGPALHWYAKAVKLDHRLVNANLRRGEILLRRGDAPAADVAFRAGLKTERDNPRLLVDLALARLAQKRPDDARALLVRAESLAPTAPGVTDMVTRARQLLEAEDGASSAGSTGASRTARR